MPNWCANLLEIAGPTEEKKRFLENAKSIEGPEAAISLKRMVPYPEGVWDYNWCVDNWGTKWDIDAELMNPYWEDDNENLVFKFDSAWGPPDVAFETIAKDYPKLGFCLLFAEPGMGFEGSIQWNTELTEYVEFPATNRGNVSDISAGYIWSYVHG